MFLFLERFGIYLMKKSPKQFAAIAALVAFVGLIIAFVISAFTAGPGEAGNQFMALLFGIISIPLLTWIILFCIRRMQDKHTITELFSEDKDINQKKLKK